MRTLFVAGAFARRWHAATCVMRAATIHAIQVLLPVHMIRILACVIVADAHYADGQRPC